MFFECKHKHLRKIERLAQQQTPPSHSANESTTKNWLINTTNCRIPNNVSQVLELGPKFAVQLTTNEVPTLHLLADVEYCIENNPEIQDRDTIRSQCTNIITNQLQKIKNVRQKDRIANNYRDAKRFLKENNNLLVLNSDKGNNTVILEKTEYETKMSELVNDAQTYSKLPRDPTSKIQTKNNALIKKLQENNILDNDTSKSLKIYNAICPKIYGLPKIHKENRPLRPIVSCINSPTYKLSKYLNCILKSLIPTFKFNVKNSFEVADRLKNTVLPENYTLVSLDVKSLFTNIPKDLVIHIINSSWPNIESVTPIEQQTFVELITFLFDSSYFSYKSNFYKQEFGVPMGDPISPILANMVMNYIAVEVVKKLNFELPFLFIYVDDTLTALPNDDINTVLNIFNSINPSLSFTIEKEKDKAIPFLDLLIINKDNKIIHNLYKKPSSSTRILNYKSAHALHHKINIIKQFQLKIYRLSDKQFWQNNLMILKNILTQNNYPKTLINKILSRPPTISREYTGETDPQSTKNRMGYFKIPFIENLSQSLAKKLKTDSYQIAYYNTKKVGHIFSRVKDKTDNNLHSNVIYQIPCGNCNNCYIGQTKQHLRKRVLEHKRDCNISNAHNPRTALALHHFSENHHFKFDEIRILDRETNYKKRLFLEMAQIQKTDRTVNLNTDVQSLSRIYYNLIRHFS